MSRLTYSQGYAVNLKGMPTDVTCEEYCANIPFGNGCDGCLIDKAICKLAHYEDLEEQLEKLYGGKMPLGKVVENLNRIVQNGEEKLDYARILTNAEAEKWDKWKDLEEQGRLAEVIRCKDCIRYGDEYVVGAGWCDEHEHLTNDDDYCSYAVAKLAEVEGAE